MIINIKRSNIMENFFEYYVHSKVSVKTIIAIDARISFYFILPPFFPFIDKLSYFKIKIHNFLTLIIPVPQSLFLNLKPRFDIIMRNKIYIKI